MEEACELAPRGVCSAEFPTGSAVLLTSVRRGFSLRFERLLPPRSPILGNSEPEILAQSPSLVGDFGGFPNS